MGKEIEIVGLDAVEGLIARALDRALIGLERGLYHEELEALAFSQKIVPVDTGILRSSGHAELPRRKGRAIEGVVGYGGPASSYAVKVHEDLQARHTEGQEAKFLEKGALSREQGMGERLADEVRRAVGGD